MRTLLLGLGLLLAVAGTAVAAGSNQTLNIQGVLRDAAGSLQSMAVGIDVNLYVASDAKMPFYSQHFTTVPVDGGFFAVELSDPKLTFAGMPDVWVGVQIAGDQNELPRQHLGAAPYAFTAGSLDPTLCSGCVTDGMVATLSAAKLSGVVAAANGGTGLAASGAAGNVLVSDGTTWQSQPSPNGSGSKRFVTNIGNGTTDIEKCWAGFGLGACAQGGAGQITCPSRVCQNLGYVGGIWAECVSTVVHVICF